MKYHLKRFLNTYILCAAIAVALAGCGANFELASSWRNREIVIDGSAKEWRDLLQYLEKSSNAIAVCNDSSYLYVCLSIADKTTERQMIARGFTVWLDPKGGEDKSFGIHFPLGIDRSAMQRGGFAGAEDAGGDGEAPTEEQRRERLFDQLSTEMEIIGPDKDAKNRFPVPGAHDVIVQVGHTPDETIYELKVPLKQSPEHPYAIGADAGKDIGLGLEVTANSGGAQRQGGEEGGERGGGSGGYGGTGGGMGRGGGRRGGRGGGAGGNRGGGQEESLNVWAHVKLSDGTSPSQRH